MQHRVKFDFDVTFSNGGSLRGDGFRLDIEGDDINDDTLAAYIVRDLRLLMVERLAVSNKTVVREAHKRTEAPYRLHYSPGACSLAVHAVLRETRAAFELVDRNIRDGGTQSEEYLALNPRARVPAIEVEGEVRTEVGAILLMLGERHPEAKLLPAPGSMEKFRVLEWVSYLGTTLHPLFWGVWRAQRLSDDESHHPAIARTVLLDLESRYAAIDRHLQHSTWLAGEMLTIADFYLYVFTRWTRRVGLPFAGWDALNAHYAAMNARNSVQDALRAEGLEAL